MAIGEVELGAVNRRLVGLHQALVLADEGVLPVDGLPGDGVLLRKLVIAGEIDLGLRQLGLGLAELALALLERDPGDGRPDR